VKPVLLDSGVIVSAFDRSERSHRACAEAIVSNSLVLVTCEAVIAESCYLLRNIRGAPDAVLANVAAGIFHIPIVLSQSAEKIRRILHKYRDRVPDLADACLIHLATELNTAEILTLDRDFEVYRWGRNSAFQMLIPLEK
jgi:predicted nucleic acid-binding protein